MPAATTHVEFARDLYNSLPAELQKNITNMPMYFLGSQGPDLFFFSRFMALPGTLNDYGNLMHDERVAESIMYMDAHSENNPRLRSYFMGFLAHYALDSTVHPLVNAFAAKEHAEKGTHKGEAHFRQEGELDVYVLSKKGRSASGYNVFTDLKVSASEAEDLAGMYHGLFREVYGIEIPEARIRETVYEVYLITKLLKPGKGKYALLRSAEGLLKLPHMISGMMLYDKQENTPVLNKTHETWEVPGYGGLTDNRSFDDLYAEALEKARHLMVKREPADFDRNFSGLPVSVSSVH